MRWMLELTDSSWVSVICSPLSPRAVRYPPVYPPHPANDYSGVTFSCRHHSHYHNTIIIIIIIIIVIIIEILTVDLPPDEEMSWPQRCIDAGLCFVPLIAPTTTDERLVHDRSIEHLHLLLNP